MILYYYFFLLPGEAWVNNVKILGWSQVKNGIIISIEDFLFTEHIDPELIDLELENGGENIIDVGSNNPKTVIKMYNKNEGNFIP